MKLKYEFSYIDVDDEVAAVPVGDNAGEFHGMLTINDTAKEVLELIKMYDTPEQLHKELCRRHPEEDFNEVGVKLCDFLNNLVREGILEP